MIAGAARGRGPRTWAAARKRSEAARTQIISLSDAEEKFLLFCKLQLLSRRQTIPGRQTARPEKRPARHKPLEGLARAIRATIGTIRNDCSERRHLCVTRLHFRSSIDVIRHLYLIRTFRTCRLKAENFDSYGHNLSLAIKGKIHQMKYYELRYCEIFPKRNQFTVIFIMIPFSGNAIGKPEKR